MHTDNNDTDGSGGRRRFLKALGATGTVTALAGCSGGNDQGDGNATGQGDATPKTGGELVVATQADVGELDPHRVQATSSLRVLNNVYQKLVTVGTDLKPVPQLAKDWTVSDDGLTWTFELHQGVTFHPPVGRECTAEDVVYSIRRLKAKETGSPWRANFTPIENVTADGKYTVVFEFDEPFAPFLVKLRRGFIIPKGAAEATKYDLSKQPVGTGPFVFEETVAQTRTTLTKFDEYWQTDDEGRRLPYLDTVTYRPMPSGQSRTTALKANEVDFVVSVPRSQATLLEGSKGVVFSQKPGTFYDYVGQNTNKPPLDDAQLRRAVSWAVDRSAIAKAARFGYATSTQSPIPPESLWQGLIGLKNPFSHNKQRARRLVKQSKYDGETLEIQVGQEYQAQVNEAKIVAEQLRDVGVNVAVRPLTFSTMITNLNNGAFDLTVLGWSGLIDPDSQFYLQFHTGEKFNQTNYSNDRVDQLLERGRHAVGSREKRAQYYDQALDIIAHDAPYTFLVFNDELTAWRESVRGFTHLATGVPYFKTVWVSQ